MYFCNYIYCLRTMPNFPNVRNVGDRIASSRIDGAIFPLCRYSVSIIAGHQHQLYMARLCSANV